MSSHDNGVVDERFDPDLVKDIWAVLERHGYKPGDRIHTGASVGLLLDLVQAYEATS